MPTDELSPHDVTALLREIRPDVPPATEGWGADQRARLLTFIDTGEVARRAGREMELDGALVRVGPDDGRARRTPVGVVIGVAAAFVLLLVGLVVAPRWRGAEPPAATVPTPTTSPATAPPAADRVIYPDRFAIVPDDHPLANQATAMYGGMQTPASGRYAEALVAVDDGSALRGAAALRVYAEVTAEMFPGAISMEVAGVTGRLWTEPGSPSTTTFITDGVPALAVQAADATAFVEAAGGVPIVDVRFGADGLLGFDVAPLPDGYSVIVPPGGPAATAAVNALTTVPDAGNGDGISVWVETVNPLTTWGLYGDMNRVDIDGVAGWMRDDGPGSPVIWQVSDTTWAMVGGAMNVDDALALARVVEFVDRDTWEERYDVATPTWPSAADRSMAATATTEPPLVALEEVGSVGTDVPIGCGSIPPRDETIASPVVASSPATALAAFVEPSGFWRSGWIDQTTGDGTDATHRFEQRREDGLLVMVVYVDAVDGGWAATRWLSTPC